MHYGTLERERPAMVESDPLDEEPSLGTSETAIHPPSGEPSAQTPYREVSRTKIKNLPT